MNPIRTRTRESLQKQGSLMLATLQQLKEVKTMGGQRKETERGHQKGKRKEGGKWIKKRKGEE